MKSGEWTLRSRSVVTPAGTHPADILIAGETIAGLGKHRDPDRDGVILDVDDWLVLPGLIDLQGPSGRPPGGADSWHRRATACAAAGGVTTVVELPTLGRASPTSPPAFEKQLAEIKTQLRVDCGFLGLLAAGSADRVAGLVEAGVLGIVAILDRPSAEDPSPLVGDLVAAMRTLRGRNRPLLVLSSPLANDPVRSEANSVRSMIALAREHACHVHFLGVSTAEGLAAIAEARGEGLSMSVATSIDQLVSPIEELSPGDPRFSGDPSSRTTAGRERLWDGLRLGLIDAIGSGHHPAGARAIPSTEPGLARIWSEARRRGFTPDDLARWMARRPAELLGLAGRKGSIVGGADADFVIVDPAPVDQDHDGHPGKGASTIARVVATVLRGQIVYESGKLLGEPLGIPTLRLDETERVPSGLERLNHLSQGEAAELLRGCCRSSRWAWRMQAIRPFHSLVDLLDAADRVWATLDRADQLEALAAHPRLSDVEDFRIGRAPEHESPGLPGSSAAVLEEMARADREYEAKFDHHFLVSDADLAPADVLGLLRQRLQNDRESEFRIAAAEQAETIRRRLRNLVSDP